MRTFRRTRPSRTSSRTQGKPSQAGQAGRQGQAERARQGQAKPDAPKAKPKSRTQGQGQAGRKPSHAKPETRKPDKALQRPPKPDQALAVQGYGKARQGAGKPRQGAGKGKSGKALQALAVFAGQAGRARRKPSAQAASRKRNAQGRLGGVYRPAEIFARFPARFRPFPARAAPYYGRKVKPVTGARLTYRAHGLSFTARLLIWGADDFLYGRGLNLARTARSLSARKRWARLHENECR